MIFCDLPIGTAKIFGRFAIAELTQDFADLNKKLACPPLLPIGSLTIAMFTAVTGTTRQRPNMLRVDDVLICCG